MKSAERPFGRIVSPFLTPSTRTSRFMREPIAGQFRIVRQFGDLPVARHLDELGVGEAREHVAAPFIRPDGGLEVDPLRVEERARQGHPLHMGRRRPRVSLSTPRGRNPWPYPASIRR